MIGGFSKNGQTLEQGQGASNFQQGALVLKILIFPLNFPNTGRIQALILYFWKKSFSDKRKIFQQVKILERGSFRSPCDDVTDSEYQWRRRV